MTKHTPGPWRIYFNSRDDIVIRKLFADGQETHVVARCHSGIDNALLIAAAPDLLESAKKLVGAMSGNQAEKDYAFEMFMLQEAIAKAEGEMK